jgi:hypothetical protein
VIEVATEQIICGVGEVLVQAKPQAGFVCICADLGEEYDFGGEM